MAVMAVMVIPVASSAAHADDSVVVHIESNKLDATLERVAGEGIVQATGPGGTATAHAADYQMVYTVPCDKPLDRNTKYVFRNVSGFQGMSGTFVLPPRDRVRLDVKSGPQGLWGLGVLGTMVGATGALVGGTFAVLGLVAHGDGSGKTEGGLVTLGISVPILIAGIYLMATNATSVTTEQGESLAKTKPSQKLPIGLTANGLGGTF